jgi:hypothetical protein
MALNNDRWGMLPTAYVGRIGRKALSNRRIGCPLGFQLSLLPWSRRASAFAALVRISLMAGDGARTWAAVALIDQTSSRTFRFEGVVTGAASISARNPFTVSFSMTVQIKGRYFEYRAWVLPAGNCSMPIEQHF